MQLKTFAQCPPGHLFSNPCRPEPEPTNPAECGGCTNRARCARWSRRINAAELVVLGPCWLVLADGLRLQMGLHGCHFFLPLLLGTVLLGPPADAVRDAGQGCPAGWGGGAGRRGEREAPDCQSVRRSFPSIQTGEVVVAPSRVSPLAQFRHTFPKPFRSAPHVLASVNGFVADVSPGNAGRWDAVNASFVVTIRSTGRAGFSANIYRTDASPVDMTDGWHGPLLVHYVAWDYFANASGPGVGATSKGRARAAGERGREGEVGILFGSWTVDASQTAPPGAPWVAPAGRFRPEDYGATVTPHKAASQPGVDGAGWGEGLDGGGPAGEHRDDGDMPSELAAYGGGQPEVVRIAFGTSFGEPPRLLVGARLTGPHDRQAVLALTVAGVTTEGCEVHVARVDQSWAVQALALDYIAWLPSYDMVTAPDMADPAARAYNGTGALRGGRILASSLPAAESGACAGNCADRQWSRDLDPYVLPRAQFGGHVLPPPVPITAGRTEYTHPDARWGGGSLAAGMGLGKRGARLPSSVQYQLRFDFKDIFAARRTGFNFTRPPWLLVSARIASASRPEHAQATPETVRAYACVCVRMRAYVCVCAGGTCVGMRMGGWSHDVWGICLWARVGAAAGGSMHANRRVQAPTAPPPLTRPHIRAGVGVGCQRNRPRFRGQRLSRRSSRARLAGCGRARLA